MDTNALVEDGHKLVRALHDRNIIIDGAAWVRGADTGVWRLWLVPRGNVEKREFYRIVAEVIRATPIQSMDASDTELMKPSHPGVRGLAAFMQMDGLGSAHLTNNTLNGYFIPDAIVLTMHLQH